MLGTVLGMKKEKAFSIFSNLWSLGWVPLLCQRITHYPLHTLNAVTVSIQHSGSQYLMEETIFNIKMFHESYSHSSGDSIWSHGPKYHSYTDNFQTCTSSSLSPWTPNRYAYSTSLLEYLIGISNIAASKTKLLIYLSKPVFHLPSTPQPHLSKRCHLSPSCSCWKTWESSFTSLSLTLHV